MSYLTYYSKYVQRTLIGGLTTVRVVAEHPSLARPGQPETQKQAKGESRACRASAGCSVCARVSLYSASPYAHAAPMPVTLRQANGRKVQGKSKEAET